MFGEGGQKQARVGNGQKEMPGALILPLVLLLWMCLAHASRGQGHRGPQGRGAGAQHLPIALGFFVTSYQRVSNLLYFSQSVFGPWKMVRVPKTKNYNTFFCGTASQFTAGESVSQNTFARESA